MWYLSSRDVDVRWCWIKLSSAKRLMSSVCPGSGQSPLSSHGVSSRSLPSEGDFEHKAIWERLCVANLHWFKGYYNGTIFPPPLLFFFPSHTHLLSDLTPVSVDVHTLLCFDNPFDVWLSAVMSLFKGFRLVGLAPEFFFWITQSSVLAQLPGLCAWTQSGLAPTRILALAWGWSSRRQELCAIVPESHALPRVPVGGIAWIISECSTSFSSSLFNLFPDLTAQHSLSLSDCLERLSI